MRPAPILASLFGLGIGLAGAAPAHAFTTVCTPGWNATTANNPATGTLAGASPPCPASAVTASINNIQEGKTVNGTPTNFDWGAQLASNYPTATTTASGMAIGADQNYTITFSQAVLNPYIYFAYIDQSTWFTFSQPFQLVQANNAQVSTNPSRPANTVEAVGSSLDRPSDGFVVQMLGTYTTVGFFFDGVMVPGDPTLTDSVLITAGIDAGAAPVPGPLPALGGIAALRCSRRLRARQRRLDAPRARA